MKGLWKFSCSYYAIYYQHLSKKIILMIQSFVMHPFITIIKQYTHIENIWELFPKYWHELLKNILEKKQ